jgi:hypothetical protein
LKIIERNQFNVNAINVYFSDEFDDRFCPNGEINFELDIKTKKKYANANDSTATNENQEKDSFNKQKTKSTEVNRFIKLYRRINDVEKNNSIYSATKAHIHVPLHLNSAIIRFKKFKQNNYFLNNKFETRIINQIELIKSNAMHSGTINLNECEKSKNLMKLKAALWSICSLCNCEDGFEYLNILNERHDGTMFASLFEFITFIVKIAESYSVLSVRATGLCCLNYLSKTNTGANMIGKLGWQTFQPNSFFSIMTSMKTNQELDLSYFYSSIDTAMMLYNFHRFIIKNKTRNI